MVRPIRAEVLQLAIPLRLTFKHALAERSAGESVVVRLVDDAGRIGTGECAPREYVTGETPATVRATLARLLPRFLDQEYDSLATAANALADAARELPRNEHAAFCVLELALLDLVGGALGVSAGSVLGPIVRAKIAYSGVVSADDAATVRSMCERIAAMQLGSVKLKVGRSLESDLEVLQVARSVLGDACSLRVDANCAWTAGEAFERLTAFAPFRLDGIEQPVGADDVEGMAWLTARSRVPIIADESLVSVADAERLVAARACHLFNVRISKCGGLLQSLRIRDLGLRAGIGSMLGAQVGETALLSAAGRHFATRVPDLRHFEGSFGTLLLEQEVAVQDLTFGLRGEGLALDGPGLGVDVDELRLRAFASPVA